MKLLSIGNSWSVDAQRWIPTLAGLNGIAYTEGCLYVGGCSLERHWNNWLNDAKDYTYYINASEEGAPMSIREALALDTWDIITFQQASHDSGLPQTYTPYLTDLAAEVRKAQPKATFYFNEAWAYEIDSDHPAFPIYNCSQQEMRRRQHNASLMAAEQLKAPLLPVGSVIEALREQLPEFDYKNGGKSLTRDGFHLSQDYGRFAAAATWLYTITRQPLSVDGMENYGFDLPLLRRIMSLVIQTVNTL